ncbi:MAG TPA: hypothetical protein VL172_04285 [Kofleriaceae bacterium]|nr:hypothetical protein [Kofleriaceae bacterium]
MLAMVLAAGCSGKDGTNGTDGTDGTDGVDGVGCTVTDNGDGTKTITCDDGTVIVTDGTDAWDGQTMGLSVDISVAAPANGTNFVAGEQIAITIKILDHNGDPIEPSDLKTLNLYLNGPRNPRKTKTASALLGASVDRSASTHHYINLKSLYPACTGMMVCDNDELLYTTNAVSAEDAGTYTIGVWAVPKDPTDPASCTDCAAWATENHSSALDQVFELKDIQIKTAIVETEAVDGMAADACSSCHLGAASGQMYMHHVDPGYAALGSPSLDSAPVRTCKMCHNVDGYASVKVCADGSKPNSANLCADGSTWSTGAGGRYLSDQIVRRVHGVHMGEKLSSEYNTNETWGDFKAYGEVNFPYDVRNCTKCHGDTDQSWKTPTRAACTGCHDNLDFDNGGVFDPPKTIKGVARATTTECSGGPCYCVSGTDCMSADGVTPVGGVKNAMSCNTDPGQYVCMNTDCRSNADCDSVFSGNDGKCNVSTGQCELTLHTGTGADDTMCIACHSTGAPSSPAVAHAWRAELPAPSTLTATLSAGSGVGGEYLAGDRPTVTFTVSGLADHAKIDDMLKWTFAATGVDSTTDVITVTSHGLANLSGPYQISKGAGATLPGNVKDATNYWVIVTGTDTFKLASSRANAVAGTAVDISSNGSGTLNFHDRPQRTAYMFINGPRERRVPGLTSAARGLAVGSSDGPWNLTSTGSFSVLVGSKSITLGVTAAAFPDASQATPAQVVSWLNANMGFRSVAFAFRASSAGVPDPAGLRVAIVALPDEDRRPLRICGTANDCWTGQALSTVTTAMSYTATTFNGVAASTSYAANSWLNYADPSKRDPRVTWSTGNVVYQLDDVATVQPGTYTLFAYYRAKGSDTYSMTKVNFQVGTAVEEKKIATNCVDCHGDTKMHSYPFDTDYCGSCHDYKRNMADRTSTDPWVDGWGVYAAPSRGNAGYGAAPIARRAHGMHYSAYMDKPEAIHGSSTTMQADIPLVVFPQDVRNCVKCHSESDSWMNKPSRLACNACHDSDAAIGHGMAMTYDPTPVDPWNGDEVESCATCHESGADFAVISVHNIWDPYKPPYPREAE